MNVWSIQSVQASCSSPSSRSQWPWAWCSDWAAPFSRPPRATRRCSRCPWRSRACSPWRPAVAAIAPGLGMFMDVFSMCYRWFWGDLGDLDMTMLITRWISMWFLGQIHPNGPNRPSVLHQFSCSLWFLSCWKFMKIWHLPRWCLLALHFHWGLWKILVLLRWQFKNACWTPSNNVTFFGWFFVSPKRQRFFSIASTCITWSVFTECTT